MGISGVFIYANDPATLKDWYARHLGFSFIEWNPGKVYGFDFLYDMLDGTRSHTVFSIMKTKEQLQSPRKEFMVNYRVKDLNGFLIELEAKGIPIEKREDYDYGLFAWISDPEGNRIELYQPLKEPGTF